VVAGFWNFVFLKTFQNVKVTIASKICKEN
jgi:hypothetical protein